MSAAGFESTIAVAMDQILRLAPSISPPIEPVVSSTKATSTVGLARADDGMAKGRVARTKAKAGLTMRGIAVLLRCVVPWVRRFHRHRGSLRSETRRATYQFAASRTQ